MSAPATTATRDTLRELDAEMWLAKRISCYGEVFEGVTDRELRRERIHSAILKLGLELAIAGRNPETGKPENFRETFERAFREPLRLEVNATRAGAAA